ncbi:MAG: ABC transporter permease [Candidatus Methylomirabilis oxyfera]|nr:ABC transporter permease [Candidatus Methylomirabilis oxyfera]
MNIGLTVATYLFVSRLVPSETLAQWGPAQEGYFPFVLIGMAMNGAMLSALTGLTHSLQLQKAFGMLKPLLLGRSQPEAVLLFSSLYPLARAGVDLMVYLLVGWVVGGVSLTGANVPAAVVTACLAIVAFGSLGIVTAALSLLFHCGTPLLWAIGSASWLLGGVLYPQPLLPRPLRWAAQLFPFTHAIQGVRAALLDGASLGDLIFPILVLTGFSLIMIPLGVLAFNIGLSRARVRGTLAEC